MRSQDPAEHGRTGREGDPGRSRFAGTGGRIPRRARPSRRHGRGRVVGRLVQRRASIEPSTFLSKGKREEARDLLQGTEAQLLVFDEDLSPAQGRNLEKELKVRVIDRSELILDIFARRARTREAMLQVELAQLEYQLPQSDAHVDPPRAAGRRDRDARTGRNAARERPPARAETDHDPQGEARADRFGAGDAEKRTLRLLPCRPGRLHERGEVDPLQCAHACRRPGRGQALRDPRHDHPEGRAPRRADDSALRYGRDSSASFRTTSSPRSVRPCSRSARRT